MSRPRKSTHIREKLISEGTELLKLKGYHGTGIKEILDRVNVPKGSFYNFFESKEKYVAEIIENYNMEVLKEVDTFIEKSSRNPLEKIINAYSYVIKEIEKTGLTGCLVGNLAAELGDSSKECLFQMKNGVKLWKSRFVSLFQEAQEKNLLRKDISAENMADIFWNSWQGGLLRMKIEGNTEQLEMILDKLLNTLFRN
ncbi:MAG: TetR family transcriptional regulator C-terminal domain-containing protein [Desulfobacteraceae bacterium]|nr:TetR family transcriptional regulator C-terminal domain-containing protein [Desulfobacteraceae bacterium]